MTSTAIWLKWPELSCTLGLTGARGAAGAQHALGHERGDVAVIGEPGDGVAEYVVQASCRRLHWPGRWLASATQSSTPSSTSRAECDFLAVMRPFRAVDALPWRHYDAAMGSRPGIGCSTRCSGRVVAGSRFGGLMRRPARAGGSAGATTLDSGTAGLRPGKSRSRVGPRGRS